MAEIYVHHRVETDPRQWQAIANELRTAGDQRLRRAGGSLYGIWRNQIGRPRDEVAVITVWPDECTAQCGEGWLLSGVPSIRACDSELMMPTLRPTHAAAPHRQGNYAFRWFETPARHWQEFLDLCESAWPGFEAAYDSQVIGLWRCLSSADEIRRSLLLTRRPDLATWERSKIPEGEAEVEVRRKLSRRYDLCDWTCVYTTTLLTATDRDDTARWT